VANVKEATASPKAASKRLPSNTTVISVQGAADRESPPSREAAAPPDLPPPNNPAAGTDDNSRGYTVDILGRLVSPQSLFVLLWYIGWYAVSFAEWFRLQDEGHPPEYASIEFAAYRAVAFIPFYVTAGWFQANMLAAPGNPGWLLGVMGPVFSFASIAATQNIRAGVLGLALADITFFGCIFSKYSPSRAAISFVLIAFALLAQFGLAVASSQLPALKAALPPAMAGLVAPLMTLLYESVAHLGLATAWQQWGETRETGIITILTAVIVQSGEIVRLVGVLSAVTAETPLHEGFTSVAAGVLFDWFARTKLRHVIQMAVLNKTEYAPSAEYGLLLQLKYKFGYTPILVAVPYLVLLAAAGDESARQPLTWALLVMHIAGESATDYLSLLWQNYLHQSTPGAPPETLWQTFQRVTEPSGHLFPKVSCLGELRQAEPRPANGTNNGLDKLWQWPPKEMAGAFLLVMAAGFFILGYDGAVAQPWRELQLGLDIEGILTNSTLVGNSTLVNGG
jgi:hypothetical protein